MSAAPAAAPVTLRAPGARSAWTVEQVGFSSAVSEPGRATPAGEPCTDAQLSRKESVALTSPPSTLAAVTLEKTGRFSLLFGVRKALPQLPRRVRPHPTFQLPAILGVHTPSSRLLYLS